LIGFGRPAIANARNKILMFGDHCTWVRVMHRMGWSKRISRSNCTLSFIIFLSVLTVAGWPAFYHQPPAVVDPFRVILVCDRSASKNSPRSCR